MKHLIFLILFWGISLSPSSAQDTLVKKKNMAIVPFMPQMYFNDLSVLWYKTGESVCQEKQIEDINKQLFKSLNDSLSLEYNLYDLNQDRTISTKDYLLEYYRLINFSYLDTFPQKEKKIKWPKAKNKQKVDTKRNGQINSEKKDLTHQYLNANIRDLRTFKKICNELELDEVLFINQVEIRGDFSSPYNSGRETEYYIYIHYSLYDNNGKLILGNKTHYTTTNEKARYLIFMSHDLQLATSEITSKILKIKRDEDIKAIEEAKKKEKKQ